MTRLPGTLAFILLFTILLPLTAGQTQWIEDGIELCTESYTQHGSCAVNDGADGAIIAWLDYRNGSNYGIYAQRLDRYGNELWTAGGLGIVTIPVSQSSMRMIPDGEGGAILAWQDNRNGNTDVFAIRIGPDGSPLWTAGGVSVCTALGSQFDILIVSDGAGGAIFAWEDYRVSDYDIYAQAIDAGGSTKWTANGVVISSANSHQLDPRLATDNNGGAVITWFDSRAGSSNNDIYAQRINSSGAVQWTVNGLAVCTESENQLYPLIARTGWGDFVIVWEDDRNIGSGTDIYAQAFSPTGTELWSSGGIPISPYTEDQEHLAITGAEGEFVIIAWEDRGTLRISKFGTSSFSEWVEYGMVVCSRWLSNGKPLLVYDDQGGAIVVWFDARNGSADIFAQHVDSDGKTIWAETGIPLTTALQAQYDHAICPDGEGGVCVSWTDYRDSEYDIYAQRMERNGYWGYPAPDIVSALDVPSDQGGYVNLTWERSRIDAWPDLAIERYSVWRAIDEPAALAAVSSGTPILTAAEALDAVPVSDVIRREMLDGEPFYWELLSYQDAYSLETYSETVPTLFDSVESNEGRHYFQMIAHAEDRTIYWISEPDSGYSVDNLAPAAPLGLAGEQAYSPEGLQLTWDPNSESDLAGYNIYRGTSSGFIPDPGNFVTSTPDTIVLDGDWAWETGYWYKVAAVDIHGNESVYAVLGPDMVTGDDPMPAPDATFLAQNWPNPFNPNTTIAFGLKESGHVSLRIYDAAGRLVTTLVDESRAAGPYDTVWNGTDDMGNNAASGVYFYMLKAGTFEETRKMVLLR